MTFNFTKYKYYLLLYCLTVTTIINSQTSIKGKVSDKENGALLENVNIIIDKTNSHAHSDDKGNFYFVNIPMGKYDLEFERIGYEKQIINVVISSIDTVALNVLLVSKAIDLNEIAIEVDKPVSAASSSYLSQKDFNNRPKNSAQDMLRLVPGLFIAQHAGGGKSEQIFIRGFDADHGTDVATFVDGIPVNMPSQAHGQGYADLHFLIPEVVEGMSIFKGASSPLYGDFATAAAIVLKHSTHYPIIFYNLKQVRFPAQRL